MRTQKKAFSALEKPDVEELGLAVSRKKRRLFYAGLGQDQLSG